GPVQAARVRSGTRRMVSPFAPMDSLAIEFVTGALTPRTAEATEDGRQGPLSPEHPLVAPDVHTRDVVVTRDHAVLDRAHEHVGRVALARVLVRVGLEP